jgi:tetratricopeptide (TPR) repeat protein
LIADYTGFFAATQSIREWPALAALGFLLGVFLLTLVTLPRSRLVAFASLWFAITLLPVSHIIPHHELLAEHYLYLPSFSFCLLVALGLARLTVGAKRKVQSAKGKEETDGPVLESHAPRATPHVPRPWRLAVAYGLVGILLVGYGWRTVVRNRDWRDELIFYTRLVEDNSCSARARLGLGSIYERLNLPRMAITHYHIGLKCNPDDPRLYLNLGTSYQTLGMLKEAEFAYMATLKIVPNESRALSNLGFLYTELRQYDKARDALERAERLSRGRDAVVYANFGLFYEAQGDLPQALQAYEKATRLDPQNATFLQKKESMKKRLESQAPGQKTETSNASSSTPPH